MTAHSSRAIPGKPAACENQTFGAVSSKFTNYFKHKALKFTL